MADKTPPSEGDVYPVEAPPIFPQGEGAAPGATSPAESEPSAPEAAPTEPPGSDGFAAQTFVTVTETVAGDLITDESTSDEIALALDNDIFVLPGATRAFRVPVTSGWAFIDQTFNVGAPCRSMRFVMPFSKLVSTLTFMGPPTTPTAGTTLEAGIYNSTGLSLLAQSGVIADGMINNTRVTRNLITPVLLVGGVTYAVAVMLGNFGGILPSLVCANLISGPMNKWNGNTDQTWVMMAGGAGPGLPATLAGMGDSNVGPVVWLS